jgi:mycothiol synthase
VSIVSIQAPLRQLVRGLRIRSYAGHADDRAIVDLQTAAHLADGLDYIPTVEQFAADVEHPAGFDPKRHILVAELAGRVVAVGRVAYVHRDGDDTYEMEFSVDPEVPRVVVGRTVLGRLEVLAREMAAERPVEARGWYASWCVDSADDVRRLLALEGFRPVRSFHEMVRDGLSDVPEVPLPDRLEMRPVDPADHRRIFDAEAEAFRDHWGAREWTDAIFDGIFSAPDLDTSLWRVAWDGDEVAGVCANWVYPEENERLGVSRGWLEQVSVRRPWRRRGVARALVAASLRAFADRGLTSAALGVDANNPTGAVALYEGLGFRIHKPATSYRKAMP